MGTQTNRLLIHIKTAPTPNCEALEFALAMASFDLEVAILFSDEGLKWLTLPSPLVSHQGKDFVKLIKALPIYGLDQLFYFSSHEIDTEHHSIQPVSDIDEWLNKDQVIQF